MAMSIDGTSIAIHFLPGSSWHRRRGRLTRQRLLDPTVPSMPSITPDFSHVKRTQILVLRRVLRITVFPPFCECPQSDSAVSCFRAARTLLMRRSGCEKDVDFATYLEALL